MGTLKTVTASLFGHGIMPHDVSNIQTADLNSQTGRMHYYYAQRDYNQKDAFRIHHIRHEDNNAAGEKQMRWKTDPSDYTLNEALDLLSRLEKTEGLYPGDDSHRSRMIVNMLRPETIKKKLGEHYQKSEIETELHGENPHTIMKTRTESEDVVRRALYQAQRQDNPSLSKI